MNLGGGIIAPPVSYSLNGRQYVPVAAGWGGGYGMKKKFAPIQTGRVYTFVLNGTAKLPTFRKAGSISIIPTTFAATATELSCGADLFNRYCAACHVINEGGGGLAPDLAYAPNVRSEKSFASMVHGGGFLHLGMPKFGDRLSEADVESIRKYILTKATEKKQVLENGTRYRKEDKQQVE